MIRKIVSNNTPYILIAALIVLFGQFLYLDAATRIEPRPQQIVTTTDSNAAAAAITSAVSNETALEEEIDEEVDQVTETIVAPGEEEYNTPVVEAVPGSELITEEVAAVDDAVVINPQGDTTLPVPEEVEAPLEEVADEPVQEYVSLPLEINTFVDGSGWSLGYGGMRYLATSLQIGGDDRYETSLVLLDNGSLLTDYTFEVFGDWNRGASLSIIVRFEDYDNFVSCSFSDLGASASIVGQEDGVRVPYSSSPTLKTKSIEAWKDLRFGARVSGNTLECLKDGNPVLAYTFNTIPEQGTAGIGLWSPYNGEALITVYKTALTD